MRAGGQGELSERLSADPVFAVAKTVLLAKLMLTVLVLDPRSFDTFTLPKSVAAHATVDNVFLYFAVGILFRDARSLKLLAGVALGTAVPVLAYAFVQRLGLDPLRFESAPTIIPNHDAREPGHRRRVRVGHRHQRSRPRPAALVAPARARAAGLRRDRSRRGGRPLHDRRPRGCARRSLSGGSAFCSSPSGCPGRLAPGPP